MGQHGYVKKHYATASIISADRIVFNIKGNSYRLVVAVDRFSLSGSERMPTTTESMRKVEHGN